MRRIYTIPFLLLFFIPFCGNRQAEKSLTTGKVAVNSAVQLDVLKAACERRLTALEAVTMKPDKKAAPVPVSAIEAVHYETGRDNPPE